MRDIPKFEELTILVTAPFFGPNTTSEAELKADQIIPNDWILASEPEKSPSLSRLVFSNGVRVEARPGALYIGEGFRSDGGRGRLVPSLVEQVLKRRFDPAISSIGVNPRHFVPMESQEMARRYIVDHLFKPASWQNFCRAPVQAGVNLVYEFDHCLLRLAINQAHLRLGERDVPAVVFGGNFQHNFKDPSLETVLDGFSHWRSDIEAFQELIDGHFMAGYLAA